MTSRSVEIRRCQPLLGTFVEIGARSASPPAAHAAIDAAFAAVARAHRLMSFHDAGSDVARLNRDAAARAVEVDPWTYQVLEAARFFHAATAGAFDVTIAPHLQQWGYLPASSDAGDLQATGASQPAIELLARGRVRFLQPLRIDLGGIAKGFAVDRAIDALRAADASWGIVNAGGDLRVFGPAPCAIHVRDPRQPGRAVPLLAIENRALATSAIGSTRRRWRGRRVSPGSVTEARSARARVRWRGRRCRCTVPRRCSC
jgi:thiamine biosynthesis lipoprotein